MKPRNILVVLFSILTVQTFSQAKQMKFGEDRRRYIVYLPSSYLQKNNKIYPVVFNFHGGGMTMTEHMFYSGMNKAADKYNFIAVYPQGINQDWNVGFETSYQFGSNDVDFVDKLLTLLITQYRIDETAVYATGLSRGGFFCQRLAAELPERFAAIASVGGLLPDSVTSFHQKKTAIPVMVIHGTADDVVKYNGKRGAYKSASETHDYWVKHNGLQQVKQKETNIDRHKSDSTAIKINEVSSKDIAVSLVSIIGGGHTLPGADPFNIGFPLGRTSQEINNNDFIWNFFLRFKRSK